MPADQSPQRTRPPPAHVLSSAATWL